MGLMEGFEAIAANSRLAGHSNTGAVTHTLNLMNALGGDFTKVVLGVTALSGNFGAALLLGRLDICRGRCDAECVLPDL
jgi:hypothetical protein